MVSPWTPIRASGDTIALSQSRKVHGKKNGQTTVILADDTDPLL